MHAELVFTLIESDLELATSEIIVKTNSVYHGSERTRTYVVHATWPASYSVSTVRQVYSWFQNSHNDDFQVTVS